MEYIAVLVGRIVLLVLCTTIFGLLSSLIMAGLGTLILATMYKKPLAIFRRLFYSAVKGSAITGFLCGFLLFLAHINKTSSSSDGFDLIFAFSENDAFNYLAIFVLMIAAPSGAIMGGLIKLSSLNLPRRKKAVK